MAKVFISHKTSDEPTNTNNATALQLSDQLEKRHKVFLDFREMRPGHQWARRIYNEISTSDVLLVMITEDATSVWVQREIDYARGCRVSMLPVVVRPDDLNKPAPHGGGNIVDAVMRTLAMDHLHYIVVDPLKPGDPDAIFAELNNAIDDLAPQTRASQKEWFASMRDYWRELDKADPMKQPPKPPQKRRASYVYLYDDYEKHPCQLHLSTGDMTRLRGIDVLVNSENVFMQMQRMFAPGVSKDIRYSGAKKQGIVVLQDVIQHELNEQLFENLNDNPQGVPVAVGQVFVTSSGHTTSPMRRAGVKKIFHVAVTEASVTDGERQITDPDVIQQCVVNCLEKFDAIRAEDDSLKSIIFPMLGTGNAGLNVETAAEEILDGIMEYFSTTPTAVEDIYISAYTLGDAEIVQEVMDRRLHPIAQH